jgi:hypothetical protein
MKKLTLKTKPKRPVFREVCQIYLLDTGTETSEFIIKVLDLCYPKLDRGKMDVFDMMGKYREAKANYIVFQQMVEGMVGNDS